MHNKKFILFIKIQVKRKRYRKIYQTNTNQKKAEMAKLILDKADLRNDYQG